MNCCCRYTFKGSNNRFLVPFTNNLSRTAIFLKKLYGPFFYWWGSIAARLEPLQGGSLLFTTKFPEIPGTYFINRGRMKDWVDLILTQASEITCNFVNFSHTGYIFFHNFIFQRLIWKVISVFFLWFDYWTFKGWKTPKYRIILSQLTNYVHKWFLHKSFDMFTATMYIFFYKNPKYVQSNYMFLHWAAHWDWDSMEVDQHT